MKIFYLTVYRDSKLPPVPDLMRVTTWYVVRASNIYDAIAKHLSSVSREYPDRTWEWLLQKRKVRGNIKINAWPHIVANDMAGIAQAMEAQL